MITANEQKQKGRKIINKRYWSMWDGLVELMYPTVDMLDVCCLLPTIQALNDGFAFETVKEIHLKNCNGNRNIALSLSTLCDRGQDFAKWMLKV